MITHLHIGYFKCFKNFDIDLDPFTVLIGPNGSGKTAMLQAIQIAGAVKVGQEAIGSIGQEIGTYLGHECVWGGETVPRGISINLLGAHGAAYYVISTPDPPPNVGLRGWVEANENTRAALEGRFGGKWEAEWLKETFGQVVYYRLDPGQLKKSAAGPEEGSLLGHAGEGFASFLLDFRQRNHKGFIRLKREFCKRFPHYAEFDVEPLAQGDSASGGTVAGAPRPPGSGEYELCFWTENGGEFDADGASDGELLSLAYLAICYQPDAPGILLVEEPENGVHHAKLKEIVETLQAVAKAGRTQVIVTTHSPHLLDLVDPEVVRVFWKDHEGSAHAVKLSDVPDVQDWKKHFMTGEIWTSLTEEQIAEKAREAK